ncbi:glycosyltransferase family 39 protein [Candidatus Pacearchaeota archaeon]|nr:glycosyltransferase family 39 protein [Candidatus Pacearchaeota archaeon]
MADRGETKPVLDGFLERLFSLKRETWYVILILAVAFVLRLMVALNTGVTADNMVHALHAVNFLETGKLVEYSQSAALWHYITDIFYRIVGVGQLGSRAASLVFGTLSVLAIYLLSMQFFSKRIALVAAFLMAVAPFSIRNTSAEMDTMVMFFVLMAMYLFVKGTNKHEMKWYALAGVFMGLALYTKVYVVLFLPSLLLYYVYAMRKQKQSVLEKENVKRLFCFLVVAFIFTIPTLTHNYLLYQDKGFVDFLFTRTLDIGKNVSAPFYSWDSGFNAEAEWKSLLFGNSSHSQGWSTKPTLLITLGFILDASPLIFILGLLGLLSMFWKKDEWKYGMFFILSAGFLWIYLSSIFLLSKHYLFLELLLIPLAACFLVDIEKLIGRFTGKYALRVLLVIVLLITLISMGSGNQPYGSNSISKLIEFREASIPDDALVVADSRIYRGQIYWALQGRASMEAAQFLEVVNNQDQIPGTVIQQKLFYVECVSEDCGWGTIHEQPELNQTMEELAEWMKEQGKEISVLSEPLPDRPYYPLISKGMKEVYRIYEVDMHMKSSIYQYANQPKSWFLYTIGYPEPEKEFDAYETHSAFGSLLNLIAHCIVWIAVLCAVLSIILVFYLFARE